MRTEVIQPKVEIYDPLTQPVSYAVAYGLVPKLRDSIIPFSIERREFDIRELSIIDPVQVLSPQGSLANQLARYEARVLLRRLNGNPDLEGEAFLNSPQFKQAEEMAQREKRIK